MDIEIGSGPRTATVNPAGWRSILHRDWIFAGIMAASLLATATTGGASPDVWATGAASLSDDPAFEGYWKYCYQIYWSGLPHAVSHIEITLCGPADCGCECSAEQFAFADTAGHAQRDPEEEHAQVHYYGGFEISGDPSTGLAGMLLKFEPYEGSLEPELEGSARLCFYSIAAPVPGFFPDHISIKFGDEFALGYLDGPLPACHQGYSPTSNQAWGYLKAIYR
jgi:hypothetical protein